MRAAGLALLLICRTAAASTFDLSVDPRLELLGIVQRLAGYGQPSETPDSYAREVDEKFGRFKNHPAVKLYSESYRRKGHEGFGIILMYYTPPPALTLADPSVSPPYLDSEQDQALMQRFLWELRDLSEVSGFPRFFSDHKALYDEIAAEARKEIGPVDPVARVESYLGIGLEVRCHYFLDPLYRNEYSSSFIVPYPDPRATPHAVTRPFEVYNLARYDLNPKGKDGRHTLFGPNAGFLWQELLFVFIDPSFYYFEAANVPDTKAFYGPEVAKCRTNDANCAKAYLVAALVARLSKAAYGETMKGPYGPAVKTDYVDALARRLEDYERQRDKYPTLWSFYPRLFSVYHELAFPGTPELALKLPPAGPLRKATDFFGPRFRESVGEPAR